VALASFPLRRGADLVFGFNGESEKIANDWLLLALAAGALLVLAYAPSTWPIWADLFLFSAMMVLAAASFICHRREPTR